MRIDNSAAPGLLDNGPGADDASPLPQGGSWRGETVQVTSKDCDILGDAAEEISMEHSEHVESHKLEEREVEDKPEVDVPLVEQIQEYLEQADKSELEDKLRQFVEALTRNAERGDRRDDESSANGVRDEARARFANPTERFLALSYALHEVSRAPGHEALAGDVRAAIEDLHDDYGGHIRADLNTIGVAAKFGRGNAAEIEKFQAGYRDAVLGAENLAGMLRGTLERFGEADYRAAVGSMIHALGADLAAAQGPSASAQRLNAVVQELYQMEVLGTLLDGCQLLSRRLDAAHGLQVKPGALMQDVVAASGERWTAAPRFAGIADRHGATGVAPRIMFLNGIKTLVRDLPPKVFPDAEARFNAVGAVQEALDEAIAREDEE